MRLGRLIALCLMTTLGAATAADACSRLLYETGTRSFIVARSMDWSDTSAKTSLWVFPQGMQRDGGLGENPFKWNSKYGSVIATLYDAATVDGINEKGLVGNVLYLAEADYGDAAETGKPSLSIGAWLQFFLDNYANVEDAVEAMQEAPFTIVAPVLPNGRPASGHLSISDSSGDSAIFEYLEGKLVIHHGSEYRVMTNSPTYDQQLALNTYWELIGGDKFLPGTVSAADRFARLSYNLKASPKYKDPKLAMASAFSQIRAMSVPLGMNDPEHPNIASTLWRTVADDGAKRYFFESAVFPAVFWVDLAEVDMGPDASPMMLAVDPDKPLAGEVSNHFKAAQPFAWLK